MEEKKKPPWQKVKNKPKMHRRRYETASGERRELLYGRFTCKLKGKRRCIPLGSDMEAAEIELRRILTDNANGKDFDAVEDSHKQGLTFREWADDYFQNKIDPGRHAGGIEREKRSYKALKPFFGDMLLADITRSTLMHTAHSD